MTSDLEESFKICTDLENLRHKFIIFEINFWYILPTLNWLVLSYINSHGKNILYINHLNVRCLPFLFLSFQFFNYYILVFSCFEMKELIMRKSSLFIAFHWRIPLPPIIQGEPSSIISIYLDQILISAAKIN